jgi:predicted nucleic acid-binding protein
MTGKTLLFDTNAILYLAQGNKTLLELTQNTGICISSFTRFEILSYWNIKQEEIILFEDFLIMWKNFILIIAFLKLEFT